MVRARSGRLRAAEPERGLARLLRLVSMVAALAIVMTLLLACGEEQSPAGGNAGSGSGGTSSPPAAPSATPNLPPTPTQPPATPSGIEHPTGADEVIIRISYEGGFVPTSYLLTRLPLVSLHGDGCLVMQGPMIEIYPQPALPNLLETCLSEEGVQAILAAAKEAGLLDGDAEYRNDLIADASSTVFIVHADGKEIRVTAYALGDEFNNENLSPEDNAARQKLFTFMQQMTDLQRWLPADAFVSVEQPYEIERLQVVFQPSDSEFAPIAPEELEQQEVAWPLEAGIGEPYFTDDFTCTLVEGEDLAPVMELLRDAHQLTLFTVGDDAYYLYLRPLFPGEAACVDPVI